MFEEKKSEPQDIFDGIEPPSNLPVAGGAAAPTPGPRPTVSAPAPRPLPRPGENVVTPAPMGAAAYAPPKKSPLKGVLLILIALIAMGAAGYLVYLYMAKPALEAQNEATPDTDVQGEDDAVLPDGKGDEEEEDDKPFLDPASMMDSDGDGLTNARELELMTSVSKQDTDSDGLGDREEVEVYGTDPRDTDTDGDGFLDGQEVRNGFNPNGEGRLIEVPTATP